MPAKKRQQPKKITARRTSRKKQTQKKQKKKKTRLSPLDTFAKKIHRKKHFVPVIFFVLIAWGLLISAIFTTQPHDTRAERLEDYFEKYNMPIAGHGYAFIEAADYYDLDWRLLPAIAIRESSGGKHMMNNNPFGWGSARIPFENMDDAIWAVGKHLSGNSTSTAKWYTTTSTYKKLYYYNGTVIPTYPKEVMWIMEQF